MENYPDCYCAPMNMETPCCLCEPIELPKVHEYYVQPKRPKPIKPQTMFQPSLCKMPDLTIYKRSYMPVKFSRSSAIYPIDNLSIGEGKMSNYTINKLSYQAQKILVPCYEPPPCEQSIIYEEGPFDNTQQGFNDNVVYDENYNREYSTEEQPMYNIYEDNQGDGEGVFWNNAEKGEVPSDIFLNYEDDHYYLPTAGDNNYSCLRCCRSKTAC